MRYLMNIAILWLLPGLAIASPFVVSDVYPTGQLQPTDCGVFLDNNAKVEIPITVDANGVYCKYDIGGVTVGKHIIKMTHIRIDTLWGSTESIQSLPLSFEKPGELTAPSGLKLSIQ